MNKDIVLDGSLGMVSATCLHDADMAMKVHETNLHRLNAGISIFTFLTTEGEIRVAVGTLHPDRIPPCSHTEYQQMDAALRLIYEHGKRHVDNPEPPPATLEAAMSYAERRYAPKEPKKSRAQSGTDQKYYDLERGAWRSYKVMNILTTFR